MDFEQMRKDWWVRAAIVRTLQEPCTCHTPLICLRCKHLDEAQQHFPVQYFTALHIHTQPTEKMN